MPSESNFKRQVDIVRETLKIFYAVRELKAPFVIRAAIIDLIDSINAFNPFTAFFLKHDLFQEMVPAVFNVLNAYALDHPNFDMPSSFDKVSILNNRVRGSFSQSVFKKGMFYFFSFSSFYLSVFQIVSSLVLLVRILPIK